MIAEQLLSFDVQPIGNGKPTVLDRAYPEIRLAHVDGAQGDCTLKGEKGIPQIERERAPGLLVSYYYLPPFLAEQSRYCIRDWMLDSGAFSAWNSGGKIDMDKYIDCCHKVASKDTSLVEIVALDVIKGDAKDSLANALLMKKRGINVIPVFHYGEDWGILREYCNQFHKVGLSCRFGEPMDKSRRFYDLCFAYAWPKRFHSFGWIERDVIFSYPFHSGDAASWELAPCAFGNWQKFGKMSVRGSAQDLRSQVSYYMELEAMARVRWKKEMLQLEALEPLLPPLIPGYIHEPMVEAPPAPKKAKTQKVKKEVPVQAIAPAPASEPAPVPVKKELGGAMKQEWVDYWANWRKNL